MATQLCKILHFKRAELNVKKLSTFKNRKQTDTFQFICCFGRQKESSSRNKKAITFVIVQNRRFLF
jgi:hypothetical protein